MAKESKKAHLVIFVCTGNTCRSPMAEKLFMHALAAENNPLSSINILSVGVSAPEGWPASPNAIKAVSDCGLDLNEHYSKQITQKMLDDAFLVFCMTERHLNVLHSEYQTENLPIYLMREFISDNNDLEIPDPIGQSLDAYKACRDSMVEAIPSLINLIKKELKENK